MDAARGLAVIVMFAAHAYDGWVASSHKATLAYRLTREVAAAGMPSFALLTGVGIALATRRPADAAARVGGPVAARRRTFALRGLRLVALGYALSLGYALLDGGLSLPTVLRGDALHALGGSLALVATCTLAPPALMPSSSRAAALAVGLLALTPAAARAAPGLPEPLRYALATLVPVPGLSRFSVLPLGALCALGVIVAPLTRGASPGRSLSLLLGGAAGSALFASLTGLVASLQREPLSPASVALYPNAADGACRALCVLGLGSLLVTHAPRSLGAGLRLLGRHSLLLYALHLPLCYGRLAAPLRGRLGLGEASSALALLVLLAGAIALLVDRARRGAPPPA